MRLLEGVDHGEGDLDGKHGLVFVTNACDNSIDDVWGPVPPESLFLERFHGTVMKVILEAEIFKFGDINKWQTLNLLANLRDLICNVDE